MRSLLMASAALMISTSFAMAQTASSAPAPTGAPNSSVGALSGSPGNMAPAKSAAGQTTMAPAGGAMSSAANTQTGNSSTASSAPAPTGAPNAAPAAPGASPGNMAPSKSASSSMGQSSDSGKTSGMATGGETASNSMTPSKPVTHHHAMGMAMASLPANASTRTFLHIAKMAIRNHEQARAEDALSHAETRMLTRSVPASDGALADSSPGVTAIENARAALKSGNYSEASSDVDMAMQNMHGGMGEMATGNGAMGGGSAVMGNGSSDSGASGAGMGNAGGTSP